MEEAAFAVPRPSAHAASISKYPNPKKGTLDPFWKESPAYVSFTAKTVTLMQGPQETTEAHFPSPLRSVPRQADHDNVVDGARIHDAGAAY